MSRRDWTQTGRDSYRMVCGHGSNRKMRRAAAKAAAAGGLVFGSPRYLFHECRQGVRELAHHGDASARRSDSVAVAAATVRSAVAQGWAW